MIERRLLLLASALLAALFAASAHAAAVRTGHVEAELIAQKTAFVAGADNVVALRLTLDKGWHTYWRNAGDSGLPTTLAWTLPAGVRAGPIEWLPPKLLPAGPLTNYGYENVALHPVRLTTSAAFAGGNAVTLAARADWLVCRETCIPEGADLTLTLPVAASAGDDPHNGAAITAALAQLPAPLKSRGWVARARGDGQHVVVDLLPPADAVAPGALRFFPDDDGRIEPSGAQKLARAGDGYVLTLPVAYQLDKGFTRLNGLLTAAGAGFAGVHAATVDVPLEGSVVAGPKPLDTPALPAAAAEGTMTLAVAALFAFVGGIILNLMPCVFPVLSLKVLGFAQRHDDRATMRVEAYAFAAGVIATFVLLAAMLLALRGAGAQLGWGFQLQTPLVVMALATLFLVLGVQLDNDAVLRLMLMLLALAFALWSLHARRMGGSRAFTAAALLAFIAACVLAQPLAKLDARAEGAASASVEEGWQPFAPAEVADLAASGRPVFVDFTAAWCVTCQVNKRTTLTRQRVRVVRLLTW